MRASSFKQPPPHHPPKKQMEIHIQERAEHF